jgi:methylaspartate mutase sigma subunit
MRKPTGKKRLAVVATTPDDSHMWNLVGVQLKLEERGFAVINLGPCTPLEEIAEMLRTHRPELLVISSINGHGEFSVGRILETLERYQLNRAAKIVVGGLLTTSAGLAAKTEQRLLDQGIHAVLVGPDAWQRFDHLFLDRGRTRKAGRDVAVLEDLKQAS